SGGVNSVARWEKLRTVIAVDKRGGMAAVGDPCPGVARPATMRALDNRSLEQAQLPTRAPRVAFPRLTSNPLEEAWRTVPRGAAHRSASRLIAPAATSPSRPSRDSTATATAGAAQTQ